ncbi:MAG: hypothetical protein IPK19_37255 [Chloroflexi bacterium]|nr:hypothetical protein [Chloroflexota bacterium]
MKTQYASSRAGADGTIRSWLSAGVVTTPLSHLADHVRESGAPFGRTWALGNELLGI